MTRRSVIIAIWVLVLLGAWRAIDGWGAAIVAKASTAEQLATAAGILIGGGWAFYRFAIQRSRETALGLELTTTSVRHEGEKWLVFFDVACHNAGSVLIAASRKRPAYDDNQQRNGEVVQYSVDLQLRRFAEPLPAYDVVSWWSDPNARQWEGLTREVDLAEDYELTSLQR